MSLLPRLLRRGLALAARPASIRATLTPARAVAPAVVVAAARALHTQRPLQAKDDGGKTTVRLVSAEEEVSFMTPEDEFKHEILEKALASVDQHGWTSDNLAKSAMALGRPSVSAGIFPRGAANLVEHFIAKCNDEMAHKLASTDLQSFTEMDRIRIALEMRLSLIQPVRSTWAQAIAVMALPSNLPYGLELLAILADEILHYAGDNSQGMEYHVKRMAVAGIFTSTELFMLQDKSENMAETMEFLNRRLHDFNDDGKFSIKSPPTMDKAQKAFQDAPHVVSGLVSTAQTVLSSLFGDKFRSPFPPSSPSSSTSSTTTSSSASSPPNSPADHIHHK